MASKKRYFFQQGKKIGGEGASISFAAFEKEGHFSPSFRNDGHIVICEESS